MVFKKNLALLLIIVLALSAVFVRPRPSDVEPTIALPEKRTVTILATGDILMHNTQIASGARKGGLYDYNQFFDLVRPSISEADYASACFEAPLAGASHGYTGYPRFNSPDEFALALDSAGYDLIVTANNHILDMGYQGAIRTMDVLAKAGLETTGTFRSREERGRYLIKDIQGVRVGYLAYGESTNGLPVPKQHPYFFNFLDSRQVLEDIAALRPKVDTLVVVLHWGVEYSPKPTEAQKRLAREFLAAGADVILGSHPHVIETMEFIKEGDKTKFVIYSMGNFIADQHGLERNSGVILRLKLTKDLGSGVTSLTEVSYTPTYSYKYVESGRLEFRIVPVEEAISRLKANTAVPGLTARDIPTLERVLADTRRRLGEGYREQ
ncbi:MAG: CapA family protein [Firmicutes bacterium]|nr:CapA family protein [Bacillota bacterium]